MITFFIGITIVGRGFVLPPTLFYEDTPHIPYSLYPPNFHPFFNFFLILTCLKPPPPLLFLFPCFFNWNVWSCHIWCVILLDNIMDPHMSSVGTLVPEGPWCVFYATKCHVYWGLTHNVVFYLYSNLISFRHTKMHSKLRSQ